MKTFVPAPSTEPAEWVVRSLERSDGTVRSQVPPVFEAYARIFHPALREVAEDQWETVPWSEVAAHNGRTVHREMQWPGVTASSTLYNVAEQPPVWDGEPAEGYVPLALVPVLLPLLSRATRTEDRCWFGVWDGWGDLLPNTRSAPLFKVPARNMHLLRGPIEGLRWPTCHGSQPERANLCWPDDRAWFLRTNVDFMWTYVGGPRELIEAILEAPQLEALEAYETDGVMFVSDSVNAIHATADVTLDGNGADRAASPPASFGFIVTFGPDDAWSAAVVPDGSDALEPGVPTQVTLRFLVVEAARSLSVGREFTFWESGRTGHGRIVAV